MTREKGKKEEGEKILNNYKKQIAEKMAREKAERGETLSSISSSKKRVTTGGGKSGKGLFNDKDDDDFTGRMGGGVGDLGTNEPPEPEVLLSILHRRTKNK